MEPKNFLLLGVKVFGDLLRLLPLDNFSVQEEVEQRNSKWNATVFGNR